MDVHNLAALSLSATATSILIGVRTADLSRVYCCTGVGYTQRMGRKRPCTTTYLKHTA